MHVSGKTASSNPEDDCNIFYHGTGVKHRIIYTSTLLQRVHRDLTRYFGIIFSKLKIIALFYTIVVHEL